MTDSVASISDLDLFDDTVLVDPYPSYAALRDPGGVVHLSANDVYVLAKYDVIRNALGDWESFSSEGAIGFNPMVNAALTGTSLASDPPVHTPSPAGGRRGPARPRPCAGGRCVRAHRWRPR